MHDNVLYVTLSFRRRIEGSSLAGREHVSEWEVCASGLNRSRGGLCEIAHLEIADIDGARMLIRVAQSTRLTREGSFTGPIAPAAAAPAL